MQRDPHDDPPAKQRPARYSGLAARPYPLAWGRHLLIYCSTGLCQHSAIINADRWPDETAHLDLDRNAVCTKCGIIGADVRPNWSERPPPDSLTGAQCR